MVYESDFYTTRRPYRASPSLSSYTITHHVPSRQVRILPGIGKVHVVHTYDRIVPYVGHKRLTVVTTTPQVYKVRPSILYKEFDRIEHKFRPWIYYSPTSNYLNSDSAVRMIYHPYTYSYSYYPGYNYSTIYRPYRLNPSRLAYLRRLSPLYDYYPIKHPLNRSLYRQYLHDLFTHYPIYSYTPYTRSLYQRYLYNLYDKYPYYRPESRLAYLRSLYELMYDDYSIARPLKSIFNDETRAIRAQTASLLKQIHAPVPRAQRSFWPTITSFNRYDDYTTVPARLSNDNYIYKLLSISPRNPKHEYTTYYSEPVKRYIGQGHLSCVSYGGDKVYGRRHKLIHYEDPLYNDIQLLSYYINRFRDQKALPAKESSKVPLSSSRPSRIFSVQKPLEDTTSKELRELKEARAARMAKIELVEDIPVKEVEDPVKKSKRKKEEARIAEEKALAEEAARKELQARKEEAARKAELARQEELAAQAAAERAAELEKRAEQARQEELAKQAEIDKKKKEEEEKAKLEEEKRLAEEAKAEEERQQLLRLEEIARQAEEEREAELARQAEELAALARQEAELAEQAKKAAEEAEAAKKQEESEELARQEAELAELERKEKELAELAEKAKQEAELAELERQQAELDALEAEAKALEETTPASEAPEAAVEEETAPVEEVPAEESAPAEENIPAENEETAVNEPVVEEPQSPEVQEETEE